MTQTKREESRVVGRKSYICDHCKKTIKKGIRHTTIRQQVGGHWNKTIRYHDECMGILTEEAINRTVERWTKESKAGNDPFKWCK